MPEKRLSRFIVALVRESLRSADTIIDVPVAVGQQPIGNVQQEIDLARNQKLWPALLSAALIHTFSGVRELLPHRSVTMLGVPHDGLLLHLRTFGYHPGCSGVSLSGSKRGPFIPAIGP